MFTGKRPPLPPALKPTQIPSANVGNVTTEAAIIQRSQVLSSESRNEQIQGPITSDVAAVSGNLGLTINLGNFESLRIDIGATIPANVEDIVTGVAHLNLYRILEVRLQRHAEGAKKAFAKR